MSLGTLLQKDSVNVAGQKVHVITSTNLVDWHITRIIATAAATILLHSQNQFSVFDSIEIADILRHVSDCMWYDGWLH